MSDVNDRPKRGRKPREWPALEILEVANRQFALDRTLEEVSKVGIEVLGKIGPSAIGSVKRMKGRYFKQNLRDAEKAVVPFWLRADYVGPKIEIIRAIGIPEFRLPIVVRPRERGRPKKVSPRAK